MSSGSRKGAARGWACSFLSTSAASFSNPLASADRFVDDLVASRRTELALLSLPLWGAARSALGTVGRSSASFTLFGPLLSACLPTRAVPFCNVHFDGGLPASLQEGWNACHVSPHVQRTTLLNRGCFWQRLRTPSPLGSLPGCPRPPCPRQLCDSPSQSCKTATSKTS